MKSSALLALVLVGLLLQRANAGSAVAIGSNGHLVYSAGRAEAEARRRAVDICRGHGGVNVRLLASTDVVGEGAIAVAHRGKGDGWLIGISLGRRSAVDAQARAIEQCRKAGGIDPKVKWGFRG
jgi:hypothetical protein